MFGVKINDDGGPVLDDEEAYGFVERVCLPIHSEHKI